MIPRDPMNPAYVFVPEEFADRVPKLYATEDQDDPVAYLKKLETEDPQMFGFTGVEQFAHNCGVSLVEAG